MSSADYVAKIYKDFLVKHFDSYHQYYNQYYKMLHENLQETDKKGEGYVSVYYSRRCP